jgi:hypothetical protein
MALHQDKKSVKRNITSQILSLRLNNTAKITTKDIVSSKQIILNTNNNSRVPSVPSERAKHQSTHHRTLESSGVR